MWKLKNKKEVQINCLRCFWPRLLFYFYFLLGWLFRWLGLLILSYTCWLIHHFLLSWMRSSSSWMTYGVIFYTLVFPCLPFPPFLLGDLTFRCIFCYFDRSSGYCCICFLLFLPSACSHSWCNDAGPEISFHYDSSHEVIDKAALFFLKKSYHVSVDM